MENKIYHLTDLSTSNFLVTGGAGFIGCNIVEYLLKNNAGKVRVLDNLSNGYFSNIKRFIQDKRFEFIEGDIRDFDTCVKAVKGMDYVCHQAALGSVPRSINNPLISNDVNVSGFLNMLTAVKSEQQVKRMVYAASSSTYGDSQSLPKIEGNEGSPLSPYAVTKLVNELYGEVFSKVYGLHTIGLRYFNIFGPYQSPDNAYAAVIPLFIKAAKEGVAPTIYGDGLTSRDFTYVENAVQANIKAMLLSTTVKKHEVINIACGESHSLNQLWDLLCEISGIKLKPTYSTERPGDVRASLADISKAEGLIGYKPAVLFRDGLKYTYEFALKKSGEFIKENNR